MDLHIDLDRGGHLRAQLESQLRDGIRTGRLQAGVRLPATRLLSRELGVSRGVVVEAYAQLTAEGYLVTRQSGGTRVAAGIAQARRVAPAPCPSETPIRFDLRTGLPDPSLFPRRAWHAATEAALRELPDASLLYWPPQGQQRLRHALNAYLGRVRAIVADEEQTFITCGSSHAYATLWQGLREHGVVRVAHEDPAWGRIPATIAQAGLEAVPVPVDRHGLSLSRLAPADVQAVVVSPAHQYPTGVVMHPARRGELIGWARRTGALIIEDDYDAEYQFDGRPIAPLRSLAPDCVIYVGTTSRILAPALRIGWLLVPRRLTEALAAAHEVASTQPSVINQSALATLLERGDIDRHLRHARCSYRARRAALLAALARALPSVRLSGGAAGLHMMAWLPRGTNEEGVVAEAVRRGVAVDGLHGDCAVTRALAPALVLGYGSIAEASIPAAVAQLAPAIEGELDQRCA